MGLEVKEIPVGGFGIIMKTSDGTLKQIGLTESQHYMFEMLLTTMSHDKKLIQLPEQYDLILKNEKDVKK